MPIDSATSPRHPLGELPADNANASTGADSFGAAPQEPGKARPKTPAELMRLLAQRAQLKASLEANAATDGLDANKAAVAAAATATGAAGSKFTANPYAHSSETLRRVATNPSAGPVLPPPDAKTHAITATEAKSLVKRMLGMQARNADGTLMAPPTASEIQDAFAVPSARNAKLTPTEAASFKQFVGVAAPASLLADAGAAKAEGGKTSAAAAPAAAATGGAEDKIFDGFQNTGVYSFAKSTDSAESLKIRSETFVPWSLFAVQRTAKEQIAMAQWALMHQKIVALAATTAVLMLQTDVKAEQNQIAYETMTKVLSLAKSVNAVNNGPLIGPMKRILGDHETGNVNLNDADLGTGRNQNTKNAPVNDLHRAEFLRHLAGEMQGPPRFERYLADGVPQAPRGVDGVMLRMPGPQRNSPTELVERTLLSRQEVAALPAGARAHYERAMADMAGQKQNDLPLTTALYDHEARLCRLAASRCDAADSVAGPSSQGPQAMSAAKQSAAAWRARADDLQQQADGYRRELGGVAHLCMQDENRYGDIMRNRINPHGGWEAQRQALATQLEDKHLSETQRAHISRRKLNLDWKCAEVDNLLAAYSNPAADKGRTTRWHTGSPKMADKFTQNFLDQQPGQNADVQRTAAIERARMAQLAPSGAVQLNTLYIEAVQKVGSGPYPTNLYTPEQLAGVSRTQMQRHLFDREQALAALPPLGPKATELEKFHAKEWAEFSHAKDYWLKVAPMAGGPAGTPNKVANALGLGAMSRGMHTASNRPENIKPLPNRAGEPAHTDAQAEGMDAEAYAKHLDRRASAGAAALGEAYQNPVFEVMNVVANAVSLIDLGPAANALAGVVDGFAQDVAGNAASELSEGYSLIAQEHGLGTATLQTTLQALAVN